MDSKNGFPRHKKTEVHLRAMLMWHEKTTRDSTGAAVSTLVNTENIFSKISRHKEAFKTTYEVFATVTTFACSTAVCKSSFSTVTAINRPHGKSFFFSV